MKRRSIMINIHIKVTVTHKTVVLTNLSEKTSLEKKPQFLHHVFPTISFPDKIFYQKNTFLQTEIRVKLQVNF